MMQNTLFKYGPGPGMPEKRSEPLEFEKILIGKAGFFIVEKSTTEHYYDLEAAREALRKKPVGKFIVIKGKNLSTKNMLVIEEE